MPQINCDVKAGKIINPEFVVKCPAGCQDPKYHVYGTDIYASYSSVCGAAVHRWVAPGVAGLWAGSSRGQLPGFSQQHCAHVTRILYLLWQAYRGGHTEATRGPRSPFTALCGKDPILSTLSGWRGEFYSHRFMTRKPKFWVT